jgi:HlyD family secretion protein
MKSTVALFLITILFASCKDNDTSFDASGTFEAIEVIVSSEVSGTIEQLAVLEGTTVEKGQLLGWIDSTQLYLKKKQLLAQIDAILSRRPHIATQLASFGVQLETAERELERVRNLFKAGGRCQRSGGSHQTTNGSTPLFPRYIFSGTDQ